EQPAPSYMLGNLLLFRGEHAAAAVAYGRALEAGEIPAARIKRARALRLAGRRGEALQAAYDVIEKAHGVDGADEEVAAILRMQLDARMKQVAFELAVEAKDRWEEDARFMALLGDAWMVNGEFVGATMWYGKATDEDMFSTEYEAKNARARLGLHRKSGIPVMWDFEGDGTPVDDPGRGEALVDFDEVMVWVRTEVTGSTGGDARIAKGSMLIPATSSTTDENMVLVNAGARLRLNFFPDLAVPEDGEIRFRARCARGPAGLSAGILDGFDEMNSGAMRSGWRVVEIPKGEWVEIRLPLSELNSLSAQRDLPPLLQRVRAFIVAVVPDDDGATPEVLLDDLRLVSPGAGERVLADFDSPIEETLVSYTGGCVPFARTLFNRDQAGSFVVPGTTPYAPHVMGDLFDPSGVGEGFGSLRLHHGETLSPGATAPLGPSSVSLILQPDRDLSRFGALTFMARGTKGGEKLRVRLVDAHDVDFENRGAGELWPDCIFPRTAKTDGVLELEKGWNTYRIDFDFYVDFDRQGFAAVHFEFGSEVGNAPGAVWFLDEVMLEF
ncbi:MAG: tetratricopeptide repeat protein, partial [Planctomycetota bacterium]